LNNLAQAFFDLGRLRAARRALVAVDKILAPFSQHRSKALSRLLMGEIALHESQDEQAEQHWKEAADVARQLNDKTLRFKAEYLLLKHAHDKGQDDVARSIHRRLKKLANWIPDSVPELKDFRDLEHDIAV
jgi:tetratricopeptide (TPR) repeat protein